MFENDYELTGKHASIVKFFVNNAKTFRLYIDVYNCAAIFGLLYGTSVPKNSDSRDTAKIYADAFANHRSECMLIYRLVMLLETKSGLTTEERIDRAFRDDSDDEHPEKLRKNLELFHSYVRGGLEVMHDLFLEGCNSEDEYLTRAHDKFEEFREKIKGISLEEQISQFL